MHFKARTFFLASVINIEVPKINTSFLTFEILHTWLYNIFDFAYVFFLFFLSLTFFTLISVVKLVKSCLFFLLLLFLIFFGLI